MTSPRRSQVLDDVTVLAMAEQYCPAVAEIYPQGTTTGNATVDDEPPRWKQFDADKLPGHRHVAIGSAGDVLGRVAASQVSDRCVHAGVVEHSVNVRHRSRARHRARLLLIALVVSAESAGIWTVQCGIFSENTASLALHHRAGFREVGVRHRLGQITHGPPPANGATSSSSRGAARAWAPAPPMTEKLRRVQRLQIEPSTITAR